MPTPAELVATAPDPTHGVVTQAVHNAGEWRLVVEIADLAVGSGVEWHDISCYVTGYDLTRGAGEYQGRFVAAVANIELVARDDRLAPWNDDTSPTFGTHVDLGAGLLMRAGWIRVVDAAVAEWIPRFTHRVESWSDETRASGNARIHKIIARDLLTELVGVPLSSVAMVENWDDRVDRILTGAGWLFGHELYGAVQTSGAVNVLELPTRPEVGSAIAELDATLDPVGLVWSTDPTGKIIVRPMAGDTFHADLFTAGATGNEWDDPPTVVFSYAACDDGRTEFAFGRGSQFGFDDTELNVVNHVRVTDPTPATYDAEAPTSISRFGRKSRQFSWLAANDDVADQIVTNRAVATMQARPLLSTIDMNRFFPDVVELEWLDPVTIWHRTAEGRTPVDADGRVRQIVERYKPRHVDEAISYSKETTVDVTSIVDLDVLLPVTGLAVTDLSDTFAEFGWSNPAQTIDPTETWVRIPQQSLLWLDLDYPITELAWLGLDPETAYQFDVRLVRRVDGLVTHVSPVRSVTFTTDPSPGPVVDPDGDGGLIVDLPDPDEGCVIDWVLSSTDDGVTWTEVTSGTANPGDPDLELDALLFEDGLTYRICSTEVCGGVPGTEYCSPVVVPTCQTPPDYLTVDPYDRGDMIAFIPEVCAGDRVIEAVSGIPGHHGPAWGGLFSVDAGDVAVASDTAVGGLIAYGETPALAYNGSATIGVLASVQVVETQRLFGIAGIRIDAVAGTTGWFPRASVTTIYGDEASVTDATERSLITPLDVAATYDAETGVLELFVNSTSAGTDSVEEAAVRAAAGNYWHVGAPAASWITNAAVWSSVLTFTPPAPESALADAIIALGPWAYWKGDDASGTTIVDYSGNGRDATLGTGSLQAWTGGDGVDYLDGHFYYDTTALDLDGTPAAVTVVMICGQASSSTEKNYFAAATGGATTGEPTIAGSAWRMSDYVSSSRTYRVETVNTSGNTYRGIWTFGGNEINAGDMIAFIVRQGLTHPSRYLDGASAGGSQFGSGGTQRTSHVQALAVGERVAHVAVFDRALTATEIADLWTAAQADGWT